MRESFFIERLDELELRVRGEAPFSEQKAHRHAGWVHCEALDPASPFPQETFSTLPTDERLADALPSALKPWAVDLGDAPVLIDPAQLHSELVLPLARAAKDSSGAVLSLVLRHVIRRTLFADEAPRHARRDSLIIELRATLDEDGKKAFVQREAATDSPAQLFAMLPSLTARVVEMSQLARLRLDAQPVLASPNVRVVLPPGADAGVLFHELCGHPLEGDVVDAQASYLSSRLGENIAPAHLTVLDDPTRGPGTLSYTHDDEGVEAKPVALIRAGRVDEPLVNRAFAERLGLAPNGHARRGSYRVPALPRMAHTMVAPHRGTFADVVHDVGEGILVQALTPRHVHLRTGDFSFVVDEARRIRDGHVEGFLGPMLLRGNALQTLASIDAIGEDLAPFFGLKGCGKANQTPVAVSFGNPTMRLQGLEVEPR